MARTLLALLVLCATGCSAHKSSLATRIIAEDHITTSYKPDVKLKVEIELKRDF